MNYKISSGSNNDGINYPDSCDSLAKAWNSGQVELQALVRGNYPGYSLNENELKGIKSIDYWNSEKNHNWGLDWHRNKGIEL